MYKILINIITKNKDKWIFYQENGADYVASSLDDIKDKALELLDEYGEDNVKIVDQRSGDDSKKDIPTYLFGNGTGGTSDYNELENKPKINGVELISNKSLKDLGIVIPSNEDFTLEGLGEKSYNSLDDRPKIPKKVSELENDSKYETEESTDIKIAGAKSYADEAVAHLVGSAPETLDTLEEVAKAIQDNETVVDALNAAIGSKADKSELGTKQDKLTAGDGIDIKDNIISVQDQLPYVIFDTKLSMYNIGFPLTKKEGESFEVIQNFLNKKYDNFYIIIRYNNYSTLYAGDIAAYRGCYNDHPDLYSVGKHSERFFSAATLADNGKIIGTSDLSFVTEPVLLRITLDYTVGEDGTVTLEQIELRAVPSNAYLPKNNTSAFTPTKDYHPATKKYVDDAVVAKQDVLTAGDNITIDENNVISSGKTNYLGYIEDYTSDNRLDITNLEKGTYSLGIKDRIGSQTLYLKVSHNGQEQTLDTKLQIEATVVSNMVYFDVRNPIKDISGYDEAIRISFSYLNSITGEIVDTKYGIGYNNTSGILSNSARYNTKISAVTTDKEQAIGGKKTFNVLPESSVEPTNDNQFVNKKYVDGNKYELPIASTDTLGGIKIGENLSIDENGVVSASGCDIPVYNFKMTSEYRKATSTVTYVYMSSSDKTTLQNIIQDAYDKGLETFALFVNQRVGTYTGTNEMHQDYLLTIVNGKLIKNKPSSLLLAGYSQGNSTLTDVYLSKLNISLPLSWNEDSCTVGTARYINVELRPLSSDNTIMYVPTSDYNPATKKYVDDTISAKGGDKLHDYNIYTITLDDYNLKGTFPTITDTTTLAKFDEILTDIYKKRITANATHDNAFLIVYSQSDTFIFRISTIGSSYCNLYGTYIEQPIDHNGYTRSYQFNITGTLDATAQTFKTTKVKFDRNSVRLLLTNNTLSYTPTEDYNPATKKYVDDSISTALGTIETTLQTINSGSGV